MFLVDDRSVDFSDFLSFAVYRCLSFQGQVTRHSSPDTPRFPAPMAERYSNVNPRRLLLSLVFFLLFSNDAKVLAMDRFSQALVNLKSQLFDSSDSLHDWSLPSREAPPGTIIACPWSGVICTTNSTKILSLDLSQKNLSGPISGRDIELLVDLVDLNLSHNSFSGQLPTAVYNLTNLRSLDISRNDFTGDFPAGISNLQYLTVLDAFSNSFSGPLPPEISRLDHLQVLNLAGSYFEGPIPPEYGSFKTLEFLHLGGNSLRGEIPPELGNLKTLTHMEIGYNSYQGGIPLQLGNMSELQYLDIADANLVGPIPQHLSNLTKLHTLFLFKNQLTGLVPATLGNISSLMHLDVSVNFLSGSIPESFTGLKNLRLLSLMYNEMNGTVPRGMADLPFLETLLIWNNFFSGSLPESLGRNSELKWLDVSTNGFTGEIPEDLCARGKLFKLILFSNNFTGKLSPALSNCSSLVRLRVSGNSISGEIALNFSLLPDLNYIDLSRNRFTGGIPTDILQAPMIQYFNVSSNPDLGGTVPTEIWSLPILQNFSAAFCNISGNLPTFKACKSIAVIELKGNRLSGNIPEGIRNCQGLETIDISQNNMIGHIPVELADLPFIGVIDLSYNRITGSIPRKFGNSSSLHLLNVSFNDLSGPVPAEGIFRSIDASIFTGNPQLCGKPLKPCSDSTIFGFGSKSSEKLIRVLILCLAVVLFIILSIFGIMYLHRGRGDGGQWKMTSFIGLPQFTANDVLKSLSYSTSVESATMLSPSVCKAVLPTGITVSVKKIEWDPKRREKMSEFITVIGNVRHKNLIRLLGFCCNEQLAYLLYDYLPNGNLAEKIRAKSDPAVSTWEAKYRIIIGISRGLFYLHHDCYPAIPHGDLRSSNIVFDENMEPHLTEFGLTRLLQMSGDSHKGRISGNGCISGEEPDNPLKEEICRDVYSFGEVTLEILSNGRMKNGGERSSRDSILKEIYNQNEAGLTDTVKEEIKLVLEVALLCISNRPSMEDALRLLSGIKSTQKTLVALNTSGDHQRRLYKS